MARDFDGVDDNISHGSDASIDAFNPISMSCWIRRDAGSFNNEPFLAKSGFADGWICSIATASGKIDFDYNFTVSRGIWESTTNVGTGRRHVIVTYDNGATTNNPSIYLDGTLETLSTDVDPVGTPNSDAAFNLSVGNDSSFGLDFLNGTVGWICYDNVSWDAAQRNRSRWWGEPGGPVKVKLSYMTDLLNRGTTTANGSATGTIALALAAPVVRPGTAMMGMGVGW